MSRYSSGGGGGGGGRRGVEDMMPRGLVKSRSDSKLADHSIPPPKGMYMYLTHMAGSICNPKERLITSLIRRQRRG